MKSVVWYSVSGAVLVFLACLGGAKHAAVAQSAPGESFVHNGFIRVIDGDTVEIWRGDSRWGIGYIDIDAPEGNTACGAAAISRQWELLNAGARFTAEAGLTKDSQGRRPYHADTLDGLSIEQTLVREGLAKVKATNGRVPLKMRLLEAEARREGAGCVWDGRGGPAPKPRQFPPKRTPIFDKDPESQMESGVTAQAISVPDFEDLLVAGGFGEPTTFDFAPDGRIFVAEKSGTIKVFKNGQVLAVPLLNIENRVNDYWDHGLLGLALDPNFAANGYIYVLYTYENNAGDYSGGKTGHLSRFTVVGDVASASSEVVLMGTLTGSTCDAFPANADCIPSEGPSHSVGNVRFGLDGKLYATFGDASSFNFVDDRALRVQDVNRLNGKVVRLNTDGTGIADNPFWDGNPNNSRSKVWAYGVRNAFRFNFHPTRGSIYLGDVGWNEREEITVAARGNNLGWPCYEGADRQAGYESKPVCQALYGAGAAAVKAPIYPWSHNEGGCCGAAAVGGAFATTYAPPYEDTYFFADYSKEWIRTFKVDSSDNLIGTVQPFMTNANGPVSLQRGLNGEIYYLAINTGEIRHIRQTGGNRAPIGVLTATPTDGLAPLAVQFSSAGSSDPDNDILSFAWNFGDGATATGPTASHTYPANGTFTATLTVSDGSGGTDVQTQAVSVGNRRPIMTISSPADASTYAVGQRINLAGSGADPDDGPLAPSALTWTVTIHHNVHTHPFLTTTGTSAFFDVPDHGDDSYFEIKLDGVDSNGLHGTASITIRPQTLQFSLTSSPSGLQLTYDGLAVTTPYVATSVANSSHTIGAPTPQGNAVFRSWSDGGLAQHNITLGTANDSRVATFSVAQSITFDDLANPDRPFSGAYPSGVATWPSGAWYLSGPWGAFATKSISFLNGSQTAGSFTFTSPRVLLGFRVYNGGGASSTVTAACGTNPVKSQVLSVGEVVTVATGWTSPCTTINLTSSNGWESNFDEFVHDSVSGPDLTPPVISATTATAITGTSATITWSTDEASTTQVEYGTTVAYGSLAPTTPNVTMVTAHSQALSGLTPGATYQYRVLSRDAAGNLATSANLSFTTTVPDSTPPVISAVVASGITVNAATITWTTNEASSTQVEYGTTVAYGTLAPATPNVTPTTAHTQALAGLAPGTIYQYRVLSRDAAGNLATSANFSFTTATPDTTPPTISALVTTGITQTSATVTWTTNEASTTQVGYGTTTSYGSFAPATPNLTMVTSHSQALTGLTAGTTYYCQVFSTDAAGNTATSPQHSFTTAADTTGPVISAVLATAVTQTGATITWATNEGSSTQVEYGTTTAYGSFAPATADTTIVTAHSQALSGLSAGLTYNYRVLSRDAAGNLTTSANFTFATPPTGSSLQFDGSNDRATASDSASLDLVGPMTLEAWVKFDALPNGKWQTIVFKGANSSSMAYAMYYYGGLWFEIRSGASNIIVQDNRPLQTGVWYHLAAVYDRVTMRLYVNGVQTASRAYTGAVVTSNLAVTLGYNTAWIDEQLSGSIDEVRISNVARYSANFTPAGTFSPDANTAALWHLDEGNGQTSADLSGNGNTLRRGTTTSSESSDPAWAAGAPLVIGAISLPRLRRRRRRA